MTMIPSQSFFNQQQQQFYDSYGGCGDSYTGSVGYMNRLLVVGYDYCLDTCCLGSDLVVVGPMADQDESRTSSSVHDEAGSSSKDAQEERDEKWLQLGLGGDGAGAGYMSFTPQLNINNDQAEPTVVVAAAARKSGLLERDLLPGGSSSQQVKPLVPTFHLTTDFRPPRPSTGTYSSSMGTGMSTDHTSAPMFLQHPRPSSSSSRSSLSFPQHHEVTWGYRPHPNWNASAAASSSPLMALGPYYQRPFQHQTAAGSMAVAGPSSTMRVIDPPRRPHSNIWFSLQASQNQVKEPFLPQIPKSYLRIKDGRMTVRVLMKYLVSKLRLDSESEIEMRCRGEQLPDFLTLQHVRDTIWSNNSSSNSYTSTSSSIISRRDAVPVPLISDDSSSPSLSTTDHLMILHYARRASP